ncbi:MAG: FAD-dependent oxidoreductase, partial [Pseudomonadota bacterium]
AVPTWMAGQAKAVALYPKPFWRNEGLSGDAMSQRGPLVEIHDASPENASGGALFGFVGVPPQHRQDQSALKQAVTAQLVRLFGASAATPDRVLLRDWALEDQTATAADQAPLMEHPRYGLPSKLNGVWDGTLWFSGSETAKEFGGFLEGALEAAEVTCAALNQTGRTAAIA